MTVVSLGVSYLSLSLDDRSKMFGSRVSNQHLSEGSWAMEAPLEVHDLMTAGLDDDDERY